VRSPRVDCSRATGFTLIELMVSMLLGLVVVAAVGSMFVSGQQVFRTGNALADVQDSARVAFEMLAHDVRGAGLTACGNGQRVSNVLPVGAGNAGSTWWGNWGNVIHGYAGNDPDVGAGSAAGARVPATPSLQLLRADDVSFSVASHDAANATFLLGEASADPQERDVFIVCDLDHAAIFRSSSYNAASRTVGHAAATNCSAALGYPSSCANPRAYTFGVNAQVTLLYVADWYLGKNAEGGTSLYRLGRAGGDPSKQEMVRGIVGLALTYRQGNGFVSADKVTDWSRVSAVRIRFTAQGGDVRAGLDSGPISRTFESTVALRNRLM